MRRKPLNAEERWARDNQEETEEEREVRLKLQTRSEMYWEDWVRTRIDSMPFVKFASGGSALPRPLGGNKPDCFSLMKSGITHGAPFPNGAALWRERLNQ
jgi:hypothetical protein